MSEKEVTGRPRGKRVPFGWVLVTEPERVLRETMYCRHVDREWERVHGLAGWRRHQVDTWADTPWLVIRRMTPKELARARKGKA